MAYLSHTIGSSFGFSVVCYHDFSLHWQVLDEKQKVGHEKNIVNRTLGYLKIHQEEMKTTLNTSMATVSI